jgi:hypothetical protein
VKRLSGACTNATPRFGSYIQAGPRRRYAGGLSGMACLLTFCSMTAFAQNQPAPRPVRPMLLDQTRYRLRAGDRVQVAAPQRR